MMHDTVQRQFAAPAPMNGDRRDDRRKAAAGSRPGGTAGGRALRRIALAATLGSSLLMGGCSTIVAGTLTLGDFSNIAGLVSTVATGKGLQEHMLSLAMGKDCRILDGMLRSDRKICEEHDSIGTDKDFKGVVAMMFGDEPEPTPGRVYAQDVDRRTLDQLGPEAVAAPSLTRPTRRAAWTGTADFARTDTSDHLETILAAAAPVVQSRTQVRTAHQAPDGDGMRSRSPAPARTVDTDGWLVAALDTAALDPLVDEERPSLSRTTRQRGPQTGVDFGAPAFGPVDSLDRLSAAPDMADGAAQVLADAAPDMDLFWTDPAPRADAGQGASVEYPQESTVIRMVFGLDE